MASDGDKKNWAKDAFKKSHRGRMHRALGIPEDQKIPEDTMQSAAAGKMGERLRKMAQPVVNVNK